MWPERNEEDPGDLPNTECLTELAKTSVRPEMVRDGKLVELSSPSPWNPFTLLIGMCGARCLGLKKKAGLAAWVYETNEDKGKETDLDRSHRAWLRMDLRLGGLQDRRIDVCPGA